ncbi:hypothetical protein JXQ70_16090 [bacterium]|nr:hypothetical protein [bacterium]
MNTELIILLVLIFLAGCLLFFFIRKILMVFVSILALLITVSVILSVLFFHDISTYRNHSNSDLLCLLVSDAGNDILAAAILNPSKVMSNKQTRIHDKMNSSSQSNGLTILKPDQIQTFESCLSTNNYSELLDQYYKVLLIKPDTLDYFEQLKVPVLDHSFQSSEIKQLINHDNPHLFLLEKCAKDNIFSVHHFLKLFDSPVELKGNIVFTGILEQLKHDKWQTMTIFLQAYRQKHLEIYDETIVFKLIRISPLTIAQK